MTSPGQSAETDALCEVMHDAYEKAAAESGWATQERSRVPWADVPQANKCAMRAAVRALLDHLSEREIDDDVVRSASASVPLLGGLSGDAERVADDLPGQAAVAQHLGLTPDGVVDDLSEGAQVGECFGSDVRVVVAPSEVDDGSLGVAAPVSGEGHASTVVDNVSCCQLELTSAVPTNSPARCCDLHGRNCEPIEELCCSECTEVAHPQHRDGSVCSNPDLSFPAASTNPEEGR